MIFTPLSPPQFATYSGMQRFMNSIGAKGHHCAGEKHAVLEWLHKIMPDANTDRPHE